MIARQQRYRQIPDADEPGWIELLSSYYEGSPAVRRDQFKRFERGYQGGVRRLLDIDRYQAEQAAANEGGAQPGKARPAPSPLQAAAVIPASSSSGTSRGVEAP